MNFKICNNCPRVKLISKRKYDNNCCFSCYGLEDSYDRFILKISELEFNYIKSNVETIKIDAIIQKDLMIVDFNKEKDTFQSVCGYRSIDVGDGKCRYLTEQLMSEFNERN